MGKAIIILLKGPSDAFRQAFRDKIKLDELKTTAHGAVQALGPNPLDKGDRCIELPIYWAMQEGPKYCPDQRRMAICR